MHTLDFLQQKQLLENGPVLDFANWAVGDAAPWVWNELTGVLGVGARLMSATEALRGGLAVTYKDLVDLPKTSRNCSTRVESGLVA